MTDNSVTDLTDRIAARAAEEQGFSELKDRIAAGIQTVARAFVDMRAVGLDNSAIARLLRYAVEELEKHPRRNLRNRGAMTTRPECSPTIYRVDACW